MQLKFKPSKNFTGGLVLLVLFMNFGLLLADSGVEYNPFLMFQNIIGKLIWSITFITNIYVIFCYFDNHPETKEQEEKQNRN